MVQWEFVKGSRRQRAYVRKRPYTRDHPTIPQRKARYWLGKISHDHRGESGVVKHGNKEIPVVAKTVADEMKDMKFAPSKPPHAPQVLLNMIDAFEQLGKAVESMRPWNRDIVPRLLLMQREEENKRKEVAKRRTKRVL